MPQKISPTEQEPSVFQIRRCLLTTLYEFFKDFPYASIELSQMAEDCSISPKELNWNMVYLEKCGYVELAKSDAIPPYIAPAAVITYDGIDLIENRDRFDKRFPPDTKKDLKANST